MEILQFGLLGLGVGSIYGLLALGLAVAYRGSGVLNLAQGGFALIGAYTYYELAVRHSLPLGVAVAGAAVLTGIAGLAVQLVVLKPMTRSSPLTRVIATLAVLIVLEQVAVLRYGVNSRAVPSLLPTGTVHLAQHLAIGADRLALLGVSVVLTAALHLVYRRTQFGRVTVAVAENERAAATLAHAPNRIAAANWVISGCLSGLAGALIAPIAFLQPAQLALLTLPALTAGLVGGFSSLGLSLLGALAIGIVQSYLAAYASTPGWSDSVPFILIVILLVVRGRNLPLRGHLLDRLPRVGSGRIRWLPGLVAFGLLAISVQWLLPEEWQTSVTVTIAFAVICLSVTVVTGYAGQLSLAPYVIAGFGALVAAKCMVGLHVPLLLALMIALVAAAGLGLVVALVAGRTRGITFAVASLGLATILYSLVLSSVDWAGGANGIALPGLTIFGWSIDPILWPRRYGIFCVLVLGVACVAVANIRRSASGRRLVAIRSSERAAASLGVSVYGAKVYAFAVSSGIAALGGVLVGFQSPNIIPSQFDVFDSIALVGMVVAGGLGLIGGAVLGSTFLAGGIGSAILLHIDGLDRWLPLVGGLNLLFVLRADQDGLLALNLDLARRLVHRFSRLRRTKDRAVARVRSAEALCVTPRPLDVRDLTVRFGGVTAVRDVSLTVHPGEVHGLIGPNGAGKTTLIDAVTGYVRPQLGRVTLAGADLTRMSPHRRARGGLIRSFQQTEMFDDLSVAENLAVACEARSLWRAVTDLVLPRRLRLSATADAAIEMFDLERHLATMPPTLSFGQRRLVAIARAVAASPSVLLLDEPAAGLDDGERAEMGELIRSIATDWGIAVLLVEHDLELVERISDRVTVLNEGAVLRTGRPSEALTDPAVIDAYLGRYSSTDMQAAQRVGGTAT